MSLYDQQTLNTGAVQKHIDGNLSKVEYPESEASVNGNRSASIFHTKA